jgi:hypothetical protein
MELSRQYILQEIKRTAELNGGTPLGKARFCTETGIKVSDWIGKYWARWGDAIQDAGLAPNKMQSSYDDTFLIEKFIALLREVGHFPVNTELRMKSRDDAGFPSHNTFDRFGTKAQLVFRIIEYCQNHEGYGDIIPHCQAKLSSIHIAQPSREAVSKGDEFGGVYLLRSGRFYKIGKSNAPGRRKYELDIQLPKRADTVHVIRTDDPSGIEEYWHKRFVSKRGNGEWFELDAADIKAFKRRKFM